MSDFGSLTPRVKICGLMRPEDAVLAVELGATHVGCVGAPSSPRCVDAAKARAVFDAVGSRAETVFVFKGVTLEGVLRRARDAGAHSVQLYDLAEDERVSIEEEGFRVYRVHNLSPRVARLPELVPEPSETRPAILDVGGGGSGKRFDWSLLGERAPFATFIAGGVRPDNVRRLMRYAPYGIDLASGVESAPGIKDESLMRSLFIEMRGAS